MFDRSGRISYGFYVETYPEVFRMIGDGVAGVYWEGAPESAEAAVIEAQGECPASIITVD